MIRSDQKLSFNYMLADLMLLVNSYFAIFIVRDGFTEKHLLFLVLYSVIWSVTGYFTRIYQVHLHNSFQYRLRIYLKAHLIFIGALSFLYLLVQRIIPQDRFELLAFVMTFMVVELVTHYFLLHFIGSMRSRGKNIRKALVIGDAEISSKIRNYFRDNMELGYSVVGTMEYADGRDFARSNKAEDLNAIVTSSRIDEIILANSNEELVQQVVKVSDYHGIRTRIVPDFHRILGKQYSISTLGTIPIVNVRECSLDNLYWAAVKRLFDVFFSLGVLILIAPVLCLIALAVKLDSPGPLFYKPERLGQGGRRFKVLKFRSMYHGDHPGDGRLSTSSNDPRITRVGAFIRKYSLDELPQFINVLKGDMSVVGPRPHRIFLNQQMQKEVDKYMVRHYLKPGITGWAQVNGWRGPTETKEQKVQRTSHDLWYLENWSFTLDLKIIYLTVFSKKTHQNVF